MAVGPRQRRLNGTRRWSLTVRGVIQGVGFRPFVYQQAVTRGLAGWVRNAADCVQIEVQGRAEELGAFLAALKSDAPYPARVARVDAREVALRRRRGFAILDSEEGSVPRPTVPADVATCDDCLRELTTPGERRFRYPFTNCTHCGPRYTIIEGLPYDRPRTAMSRFQMCASCAAEYRDPADRRFHAQPIACPVCGPRLVLLEQTGRLIAGPEAAVSTAVQALRDGRILALKGLGGFQLLADATSAEAVGRLRLRKHREEKPLAVMLATLLDAERYCVLSNEERRMLCSPEAPILLVRKRRDGLPLSPPPITEGVAPGNPRLGVMLPYTPLHHLLLGAFRRPLVCTSGNLSEEPMCIETHEALRRLGGVADLFLVHDRPIVRQVDDSVARVDADGLQLLRRARGFAPLPIDLGIDAPTILAVGGHLKNTVALSMGGQVVVSQHVGDLDGAEARLDFERTIDDLRSFFAVQPDVVACDLHPDYASTHHAELLAERWRVPLIRVQHHHAHVASCMAEHGLEGEVLGFSWDGTGYGPDGTVWGGEALVCDGGEFHRVAHLRPFPLPGGERAVREPRRSALGLLHAAFAERGAELAGDWFDAAELRALMSMLRRSVQSPKTSSVGRLFDAVTALLGLRLRAAFEGQAAMGVEFAADGVETQEAYPLPVTTSSPMVADWAPMLRALLEDRARGVPAGLMSARFHNGLVNLIVDIARRAGRERVVLSGGCFQNLYLAERAARRLRQEAFEVYTQRRVPPNDGGISLGQVLVAARRCRGEKSRFEGCA